MNDSSKKTKVLIIAPALPLIGGQAVQAKRLVGNFQQEPHLQVDFQASNPRFFPKLQNIKFLRTVLTTVKYLFDLLWRLPKYDVNA